MTGLEEVANRVEEVGLNVRERCNGSNGQTEVVTDCPACQFEPDGPAPLRITQTSGGAVKLSCSRGCDPKRIVAAIGWTIDMLSASANNGKRDIRSPLPTGERERREKAMRESAARAAGDLDRLRELRGWPPDHVVAMGLGYDPAHRFPPDGGGPWQVAPAVVFPCRDERGDLRPVWWQPNPDQRKGRKLTVGKDDGRHLYPAPERYPPGELIWLTEGEADAVSGCALELNAVGWPGVGKSDPDWYSRFRNNPVGLVFDCDTKGREKARELARAIAAHSPEVREPVDLAPERDDGYDLGDFVREAAQDGEAGLAGARQVLLAAWEGSPVVGSSVEQPPAPEALAVSNGRVSSKRIAMVTWASEVELKRLRWAYVDRIPLGKLTVLAGRPGVGKGTFLAWLAARATRGELEGDLTGPTRALFVCGEDAADDTIGPRLKAAGADLSRVGFVTMTGDRGRSLRLPYDTDRLAAKIEETGARLVVVDPVVEFIDSQHNAHHNQAVRLALAPLVGAAQRHGVAVLAVMHFNKSQGTDALMRLADSHAFSALARSVLIMGADPDDSDGEDGTQRVIAQAKQNLARRDARSLLLSIDSIDLTIEGGQASQPVARLLDGGSAVTADDLLDRREGEDQRDELETAAEFLRIELGDGPRPAKHVYAAARDAGIAERTLKRAKKELGVKSERQGGVGEDGRWVWTLPGYDTEPPKGATEPPKGAIPNSGTLSTLSGPLSAGGERTGADA